MANYFEQVLQNARKQGKVKTSKASPAEPPQGRLDGLVALMNQRRLKEAVQQATAMAAEYPNAAIVFNILGAAQMGLRNLDGAAASFGKAVQLRPGFAPAHNNLGVALKDLGRLQEAAASFSKAVQLKPDFAEAHSSLGTALHRQGLLDEAIASYDKALQYKPDLAEAFNNRGAALKDQGRLEEAISSFGKALRLKPDYSEAHNNLGLALLARGNLKEAIASFGKAVSIRPDFAEAHNNLGVALQGEDLLEEAAASFDKALLIKPDYAEAHSNLCGLHEMQNNVEGLAVAVEKAVVHCGDNPNVLFRRAQLANRKGEFEIAADYLNEVQADRLQPTLQAAYFGLRGKTCDRLGQFDQAFSAFETQNALTGSSADARINANGYLNSIQARKKSWSGDAEPNWKRSSTEPGRATPAFMIGFPRSGTTLLDTILRSHPGISVVEEKPMVAEMDKALQQAHTIETLNTLTDVEVNGLRDAYFMELKLHLGEAHDGKLIIDKLPLNITRAGLIHRVFPDAKFILVLRHPCDCVLSCFMQSFKLNDAMANFLGLEQSARLYGAVMELWSAYRQKLDIDVHVVKYEDLIQDFEGTCNGLLRFLGLAWDDNLRNYQKTALDRSSIHTPSYSQVVQPLYTQASGRWTNYRKQMEPVLPVLEPWITSFGY